MIALCVGHSRPGDSGAISTGGISEHSYNSRLAAAVASMLTARGRACAVIDAYQGKSYGAAMKWLGGHLAKLKASVAIEFHFNAADNPAASGHEWLYWNGSSEGRVLAKFFARRMAEAFPVLPARGIKGVYQKDNGAGFLSATPCPALIAEPFFGSNETDWELFTTHMIRLAQVYADALCDWKGETP
jgi:N-acetylmuramoyl-L-alanine amidase